MDAVTRVDPLPREWAEELHGPAEGGCAAAVLQFYDAFPEYIEEG